MLSEFNVASYQVHLISPISSLLHEVYIILCYVMLCYVMLCYVMLCYVKITIIQDCYKIFCTQKVKLALQQAMKSHRGSRSIALLFL